MRIPSSSSFILAATLAVSSSSPSLAAPANDAPEGGMSSSTSNHFIASRTGPVPRGAFDQDEVADNLHKADAGDKNLEQRDLGVICATLNSIPPLGPCLNKLLHLCEDDSAESMQVKSASSPESEAEAIKELKEIVNDMTGGSKDTDGKAGTPGVDGPDAAPGPGEVPANPVTGVVGGAAPAPVKGAVRKDEIAADPSADDKPSQATDSLDPSPTPTDAAGTPNNTPNLLVRDVVPGAPAAPIPIAPPVAPIPAPVADKIQLPDSLASALPLKVVAVPVVGAAPAGPPAAGSAPTAPHPPVDGAAPPAPPSNASPHGPPAAGPGFSPPGAADPPFDPKDDKF
ncbi:hypothetical protein LshimejAT787_1400790 [Lyophyllum shimeji]|uniref:Uncharacterized protein n=1 Tax=Lyophyllum shimeji TaxID=47721 RepID=A0A9P3PV99_LYOSH|nr:hypothetical protein LshimejAT787_1400790 [Lyophyllum shimeji]